MDRMSVESGLCSLNGRIITLHSDDIIVVRDRKGNDLVVQLLLAVDQSK